MKTKFYYITLFTLITLGIAYAAQVDIISTDTRNEAWTKEKANNAEKQFILTEGAFVDGDKTRLDELGNTDSPSFNALTLTGVNSLSLGTSLTNDGSFLLKNSLDSNWFKLISVGTTTTYEWIVPLVAATVDGSIVTVDIDGQLGYQDPRVLVTEVTTTGATLVLDYNTSTYQVVTFDQDCAVTVTNWPATGTFGDIKIRTVAAGNYTVTICGKTLAGLTSGTDWVYMGTEDGGTTIYGGASLADM
jgi:hypothetical protein